MYASYFGLRCQPFENRADPQFFFATSEGEETLASLEYEVRHGKGAAMLLGDAGTGKTLMVRTIVARFDATDQVVVTTVPTNGEINILRETCKAFGVTLPSESSSGRYLARLRRHLVRSSQAGHNSILIVDQAESLRDEELSLLANLADLQNDGTRLLSILMVAQPRLREALNDDKFARFRQHLFGERNIAPMTLEETRSYIQHRLEVAGAIDPKLFDDAAVDTIRQASGGIPRLVNHLCDAAMLSAYGAEEKRITQATAIEVTRTKTGESPVAERTAPAREVGVQDVGAVASGLAGAQPAYQRKQPTGGPMQAFDEAGGAFPEPATDWQPDGGPAPDFGFDDSGVGYQAPMRSPGAGIATEYATEQLERATLRAERAQSTMEASLAQHTAIEKNLTSLIGRAEQFVQGVSGTIQQATSCFDTLQSKITHVMDEAEARADALRERAVRVQDWSVEATEQVVRIEQACDRADSVENRLTSFTEQLAHKADRVHTGVAQLMTGIESSNEAKQSLQVAIDYAADAGGKMQASAETHRRRLQEVVEQGESVRQRFTEEALASCRDKLTHEIELHAEAQLGIHKTAQVQLEQAQAGAADAVREAEQATRLVGARLGEIRTRNENMLAEKADALCGQIGTKMEQVAQDYVQSFSEDATKIRQDLLQATERAEQVSRKVSDSIGQMDSDLARTATNQKRSIEESLHQSLSGVHSELDSLRVQATSLQTEVGASIASAQEHVNQAIEGQRRAGDELAVTVHGRIEDMERSINVIDERGTSMQDSYDKLSNNIDTISENMEDSSIRVTQLLGELQQSGELVSELSSRACTIQDDLAKTVERGEALGETTVERIGQVEELQRSVSATLVDLGGAFERFQGFRDDATNGERIAERISEVVAAAGEVETRLNGSIKAGTSTDDALRRVATEATEQMSRIDSHHAAASQTLGRLSEATVSGQQLLSRLEKESKNLSASVEESSAKIEAITKEVWTLTNKTENQVNELRGRDGKVAEVVKQLDALIKPSEILVTQLTRRLDAANRHSKNLNKGCEEAGQLVERITSVSKVLEVAKQLATGVEKTVADAQAVHGDLTDCTEQAEQAATKLAGIGADVSGLFEAQNQLQAESDRTSEQIAEYVATASETMDTGRRQLEDMTSQVRIMSTKVQTLTGDVATAKETIETGTAESKQIIETAQSQANQLEQVCAAVRKVFSALSKATLEARQETGNITKTCQAAGQQMTKLTAHSGRASNHLQEWVREAVRAQGRLDQTLERTPSIRDTHSSAAMLSALLTDEPFQGISQQPLPATDSGVAMPTPVAAPVAAPAVEPVSSGSDRGEPKPPSSRATELAELISNAKRAVGAKITPAK